MKFEDATTRIYGSIAELGEYLKSSKRAADAGNSSVADRDDSWDMGMGYKGALNMALDGGYWEKGAQSIMDVQIEMADFVNTRPTTELDYDVTGQVLDMDEYLSGSPECWETTVVEDAPQNIVSVGVSAFICANVNAKSAYNRGAAILSVIDEMEAQGVRVELWSGFQQVGGPEKTDGRILIKSAESDWSPSSVAFALCHPAFSRRLGFRWLECHDDTKGMTGGGYGTGISNEDMGGLYDVFFPWFVEDKKWRTPETALTAVREMFNNQLKEARNEAA